MTKNKENVYWFAYYRHAALISMDEITNGLVWRRVEELPYGFFTKEDAIDWLEFLAGDELVEVPQRSYTVIQYNNMVRAYNGHDEPLYKFSKPPLTYYYKIFPAGFMYTEAPAPDPDSPWNVGIMREMAGYPRPESIYPPRRSKLRIAIQPASAACGGYIVEI
jgi:hypothetical protein